MLICEQCGSKVARLFRLIAYNGRNEKQIFLLCKDCYQNYLGDNDE
jgi:hypothetical protein